MSTSLLYHAFAIRGYDYVKTDFAQGQVIFTIRQAPEDWRCSACGSRDVIGRGQSERRFRAVPIGRRPVSVALPVQRVGCQACGLVRQVKVPFADPRRTYTHAFERYALELSKLTTIQDVARHLDVSWDIIKDIQKRNLQRRFGKPKLKQPQGNCHRRGRRRQGPSLLHAGPGPGERSRGLRGRRQGRRG